MEDLGSMKESVQIRHTYASSLFRGMSFTLKDNTSHNNSAIASPSSQNLESEHPVLTHMANYPAVKRMYPVYEIPRPQWLFSEDGRDRPYENHITELKDVHEKLHLTGQGVTVCVLDTGIDYGHPALGEGFGEGFKVRYGYNLVDPDHDDIHAGSHRSPNDPFDVCLGNSTGHGTHVSGIIGAVDPAMHFTGVAPDATLGAWRIFGCKEGATEDTVIKAMEMARDEGCHVINLSLGVQRAWASDVMALVADRLAVEGVVVVGVAGNQGTDGVFLQNSPGGGNQVISVASLDNSFYPTDVLTTLFPLRDSAFTLCTASTQFINGTLTTVFVNDSITTACDPSLPSSVNGKILLARRGSCPYEQKLQNALQSGAIGILVYDAESTAKTPILALTETKFPCATITRTLVHSLTPFLQNGTTELKVIMPGYPVDVDVETAGQVSYFSSMGPTYDLNLKPNIAGIGQHVFSTLPRDMDGGWGLRSGTSMAAPHVSGIAALMLQASREQGKQISPRYIMEHLQNHARPAMYKGAPDHPVRQGAGLVQPFTALTNFIHISPSQLSFNDTSRLDTKTHTLQITNHGTTSVGAHLHHEPSLSIDTFDSSVGNFVPAEPAERGHARIDLEFSTTVLELEPGETAEIQVTAELPPPPHHYEMYGGYIVLKTESNDTVGSVPYFGILGRMKDLPLFDQGYPFIASSDKLSKVSSEIYEFDISQDAILPSLVVRMLMATPEVHITVLDADNKLVGELEGSPFTWERSRLDDKYFEWVVQWNGKVKSSNNATGISTSEAQMIDHGYYRLHIEALRLMGDRTENSDWEKWTSRLIHIH
ncbi:peptidase S8/S53 domain-containing protein [Radiomyces spectabilis]|uniref:peptidase S8/S53 domain-containing protein n=1 Tax=Radiomyces spectabilis TaxID=64574 RepID=UPI0022204A4B|nr:peptidase S8/S53 domain-containing protein [Radiomyces spectabilis]KAI8377473.1 peptidase S8/S53 domain-containing protein [Radiomyces spectabilis]